MKNENKKPDDFENVPTPYTVKPKKYVVATGKSFISKRGIRVPGDVIIDVELYGESDTFKDLFKKGYIVEVEE